MQNTHKDIQYIHKETEKLLKRDKLCQEVKQKQKKTHFQNGYKEIQNSCKEAENVCKLKTATKRNKTQFSKQPQTLTYNCRKQPKNIQNTSTIAQNHYKGQKYYQRIIKTATQRLKMTESQKLSQKNQTDLPKIKHDYRKAENNQSMFSYRDPKGLNYHKNIFVP